MGLTNPAAFAFVGAVQEETHRLAVTYQRQLRSKKTGFSELDGIPGIGKTRKAALLKRFKSLRAIASASEESLAQVLPKPAAGAVYRHFHESGEAT